MPRHQFHRPIALVVEVEEREKFPRLWQSAPSLRPNEHMMHACVVGEAEAIAIRDSWACSLPVNKLSHKAYQELISRSEGIVYHE